MSSIIPSARRAASLLAVLALAGGSAACNDVLEVNNPGAIGEEALNLPENARLLAGTPKSEFQSGFDDLAHFSGVITDELVTGHNFNGYIDFDLRIVREDNTSLPSIYNPLQRTRYAGEEVARRLTAIYADSANRKLEVGYAYAFGGYGSELLAEFMCEAPVHADSGALAPTVLSQRAVAHFEQAIAIANAFQAAGGSAVRADSLRNLARVGGARAALQAGDNAKAIALASAVPAGFVYWSNYSTNSTGEYNRFDADSKGANANLGMDARFRSVGNTDPRLRFNPTGRTGHNQTTVLFIPFQPNSFSGWVSTIGGTPAAFERNTRIRVASGLEARYIRAEAEGATALTLALVNERRAVGGEAALDPSTPAADIMAALREQRSRDFYLDGHRMGDLRRYKAKGINDPRHIFPTGPHPNAAWGNYETADCFIPTTAERIGNTVF